MLSFNACSLCIQVATANSVKCQSLKTNNWFLVANAAADLEYFSGEHRMIALIRQF